MDASAYEFDSKATAYYRFLLKLAVKVLLDGAEGESAIRRTDNKKLFSPCRFLIEVWDKLF